MRGGLYRKLGEILVLIVAGVVDIAVVLPFKLAPCVAAYILLMEGISILENLDQAGISIPFVKKLLKKAKDAIDEEDKKDDE